MGSCQEDLWSELFSAESLATFTENVLHGSKVRGRDGTRPTDVLNERKPISEMLARKIENGKYAPIGYRSKLKSKGARSAPRQVSIPAARDRAVIKAMQIFLKQCFPEVNPPLPQLAVSRLVDEVDSGRYKYFVRIDIRNFYPSIDHEYILKKLGGRAILPAAVELVQKIIQTPTSPDNVASSSPNGRGVPQGLAVSSLLSEIALRDLDSEMRRVKGIYYCRYVDDILILSPRVQHQLLFRKVCALVEPVGLQAHPMEERGSKTTHGKLEDKVDYLGYKLGGERNTPSVRKSSVQALERKISRLFADYKKELRKQESLSRRNARLEYNLNLTISGCVFDGHKRGWLQYYSLMRDFSLLHRLDNFVLKRVVMYGLSGKIRPKSFVKSFRCAARRALDVSGYVPNFDKMKLTRRREWLYKIAGLVRADVRKMSEYEVNREFDFRVSKLLNDMEEDLAIAY